MSETYGRTDMHSCGCIEDSDGYVTVFCAQHRDFELSEMPQAAAAPEVNEVWIINGRCMDCLRAEDDDPSERGTCGCWCHDTCPDCGRADCTGEDCYWPDEAGTRRADR